MGQKGGLIRCVEDNCLASHREGEKFLQGSCEGEGQFVCAYLLPTVTYLILFGLTRLAWLPRSRTTRAQGTCSFSWRPGVTYIHPQIGRSMDHQLPIIFACCREGDTRNCA